MLDLPGYSPSDLVPFSQASYERLHAAYNARFRPAVATGIGLGVVLLGLSARPDTRRLRAGLLLLAPCWAWVGWAFLHQTYATLHWAAGYLATVFGLQALLLGAAAAAPPPLAPSLAARRVRMIGYGLMATAVLGVPALGLLTGTPAQALWFFGTSPAPTVLATLGMLVLMRGPLGWGLLILPVAWSAYAGITLLGMPHPLWPLLPVGALIALIAMAWQSAFGAQES